MSHGRHQARVHAPSSPFFQGPFGRICRELDPWSPAGVADVDAHFATIARNEMIEAPGATATQAVTDAALRAQLEQDFSSGIPAGYTYFGQFIDHDITFDPASSLMRKNDPELLLNFRTPKLDLDNVYGRGPDDSPYLYDVNDPAKFLIGAVAGFGLRDLPRNGQGRALIGDMRNDENAIVSQLHLAFLLAHNTLVDRARAAGAADPFGAARRTLRWLYQYVVWNDFLRRIVLSDTHGCALALEEKCGGVKAWELGLKNVFQWRNQPFMPVEFAVAAYRFGHSMVRNDYQTNHPHRGAGNFVPIFDSAAGPNADDLRGFRPMEARNVVQWDWFLEMTSSQGPFPQRARKIDTKLANALTALHVPPGAGGSENVLAFRNLKRGFMFDLPSGSGVARKFGLAPIEIAQDHDALWFYILREAETGPDAGEKLGALGSLVVCAVFAGLLKGDPHSYFNIEPEWTPDRDPLLTEAEKIDSGGWTLASIIRLSGLPVDVNDVNDQTVAPPGA